MLQEAVAVDGRVVHEPERRAIDDAEERCPLGRIGLLKEDGSRGRVARDAPVLDGGDHVTLAQPRHVREVKGLRGLHHHTQRVIAQHQAEVALANVDLNFV